MEPEPEKICKTCGHDQEISWHREEGAKILEIVNGSGKHCAYCERHPKIGAVRGLAQMLGAEITDQWIPRSEAKRWWHDEP